MAGESETSRRIQLHLRITTKDQDGEKLYAFLRHALPFYEGPGGIKVRLLRSRTDPTQFIEVIEYANEEAYAKDDMRVRSDPDMLALLDRWRQLLAGEIEVEIYEDVSFVIKES